MKYTILDAHIKYFHENGFIEFENILSNPIYEKLINACFEIIKKSKESSISSVSKNDLFRTSETFKKIAFNKTITSILKTLTKKQNMRLVFDQLILKEKNSSIENFSLDSFSSFQGLIGGIIIKFDVNYLEINDLNKKNNCIFIKNSTPIKIENFFSDSNFYLLIAYGEIKTVYKHNLNDMNTNFLKKLGYNFGDTLKDELHPIVF